MPKYIVCGLILAALVLKQSAAFAGPIEDGKAAFVQQDYEAALRLLQPLAKAGNAEAQAILGVMYNGGHGVPQDFDAASRWWQLAAVQGNPLAQLNLGLAYGVKQDFVRAYMWLSTAAAQGAPNATVYLGVFVQRMTEKQIADAKVLAQKCAALNYKQCN